MNMVMDAITLMFGTLILDILIHQSFVDLSNAQAAVSMCTIWSQYLTNPQTSKV